MAKLHELQYHASVKMETHDCPSCGILYAAPDDFFRRKSEANGSWYCPNGHSVVFTESALTKANRELKEERERLQRALSRENEERAAKNDALRKLKRVQVGVCPECKRTFQNLARHMKCKHNAALDKE